ncbi:hypothetical protein ENSA5_13090 [Enhygromyxa salina]|uniref:Lipoprotein n=1 Tax=Enhygromyxa salina TaxID=215803 RepID=A0A2S9YF05_9BACT|nr:DUF3261 domain-containing protein [Enhygromyxa salina]PRQ03687.1 hypothetical protein ENSA5_13090 [Enhygromyxa salina]
MNHPRRPSITLAAGLGLALTLTLTLLGCHRGGASASGHEPSVEHPGQQAGAAGIGAGYPGELIPTEEFHGEFLARQKLTGTYGEHEFAFEAMLQLRGGTLTVLGLTPFGTKAFVLTQTGSEVEFEALIDRELPFPPEYMLQDIQRAWLWHVRLPWADGPPGEDPATTEVAGERVTEQWTANGLVRRSFARLDGEPAGEIRVDYIGGHRSGRPARRVVLENGWFGYRLEIETLDWRSL